MNAHISIVERTIPQINIQLTNNQTEKNKITSQLLFGVPNFPISQPYTLNPESGKLYLARRRARASYFVCKLHYRLYYYQARCFTLPEREVNNDGYT